MSYFAALKLFLYYVGCYKLTSFVLKRRDTRKRPIIWFKDFDVMNQRRLTDGVSVCLKLGKHVRYLIDNVIDDNATLTPYAKEAATARALGKTVYVLKFDRYNNFVQLKSCNVSVPGRNYNFLTDTFEGVVDLDKDSHVQYIQT